MKVATVAAMASAVSAQSLMSALQSQPQLSQLSMLLNQTGQASALSNAQNVTLLAPNNAAISALLNSSVAANLTMEPGLLQALLSYHVLQGNYSTFNGTQFIPTNLNTQNFANYTGVTTGQRVEVVGAGNSTSFYSGLLSKSSQTANGTIPFSGGTIHVINATLVPPQDLVTSAIAINATAAVGAIERAGLVNTLAQATDLTYFIPNNAAFSRIGSALQNISNATLASVLSYHVAQGLFYSTDVMNGTTAQTFGTNAPQLTFATVGNVSYVDNAKILIPNILVRNGVVHVIDRVLNPANATLTPSANSSTTVDGFPGATSISNVPFTSGVPTPTSSIRASNAPGAASSSSSGAAWIPAATGAIGYGALFGAAMLNL